MNNKFNDLLWCEFYKINRKHTIIKLVAAILVIVLALTVLSAVLKGLLGDVAGSLVDGNGSYDERIAALKAEMQAVQELSNWTDKLIIGNTIGSYKAKIAVLEFLKAHNYALGGVTNFSQNDGMMFFKFDFFSFTQACMSVLMSVVIIFLIVACCKSVNGEYSSGAMKMQLMRPISKNKFFTAKWLSVVVIAEAMTLLSFVLSFILGLILHGPVANNVAFVAGNAVTVVSPIAALIIDLLLNMIKVFAFTQATMFLCFLCNSYGKAIVLALLMIVFDFGTYIEYLLALPYVGYLAFFANANWASGISVDAPIFKGMTIWVMIPVTMIWCAFFMWFSYRKFNKKEV